MFTELNWQRLWPKHNCDAQVSDYADLTQILTDIYILEICVTPDTAEVVDFPIKDC